MSDPKLVACKKCDSHAIYLEAQVRRFLAYNQTLKGNWEQRQPNDNPDPGEVLVWRYLCLDCKYLWESEKKIGKGSFRGPNAYEPDDPIIEENPKPKRVRASGYILPGKSKKQKTNVPTN